MYTLYFVPGACSLATQVVLRELGQDVTLIQKQQVADFTAINPAGTVPVVIDGDRTLSEGAAVMIYLLTKHQSPMLPVYDLTARQQAIQDIMFANATMHPAYGRLFFALSAIENQTQRQAFFDSAATAINQLWLVVEKRLESSPFLGGEQVSAADIMLAVYSRWGASFPVSIVIPEKVQFMIDHVIAMPNFQKALQAEQAVPEFA
ncbi:glutathione S-transferase family protein [Photobacterium sp. 53610]|uniref:glutathione S-transferase family protein n=1 Tax=Photobacterium sp. 53610 TaxID=3102789 RepID=UPI002ED7F369